LFDAGELITRPRREAAPVKVGLSADEVTGVAGVAPWGPFLDRTMLARAWAMGAGPTGGVITIDPDATLIDTYGPGKEGSLRGRAAQTVRGRGYSPSNLPSAIWRRQQAAGLLRSRFPVPAPL